MHISEIETPSIVIDLDVMECNLQRMANYIRSHGLRLRPHTKTHKIPALGRRQLTLGAAGLTVAKVGEAEVMIHAGPPELLLAYPVIGRGKLARLMALADRTKITVSLDSAEAAGQLSAAASSSVGVLAEVDVGLGRVGVRPGEELLKLAQAIHRLPHLRFEGIAFYPGHIKQLGPETPAALRELGSLVVGMVKDLEAAGFPVTVVSGGSTPTMYHSHEVTGMNEIRPGTYIFNDWNTVLCGACELKDCAASIVATVISTAVPGQMIIDGGSKTFSSDRSITGGEPSFGYLPSDPQAHFAKMNEEHGFVKTHKSYKIGDRVRIVPNHICVAMNLHEQVYGVRGETVEEIWKVEGRGKLQ